MPGALLGGRQRVEETRTLLLRRAGEPRAQMRHRLAVGLQTDQGQAEMLAGRSVAGVDAQGGLEGRDRRIVASHVVVGGAQVVVERRGIVDPPGRAREGACGGGIVAGFQIGATLVDNCTAVPGAAARQRQQAHAHAG